jgi:DNA-binding transcriptional LysR family regulator
MDLRQLEMFQAIVDAGNFTRAGQRLHVSQSAISRQISMLEDELGVQILLRSNKEVALTEAGRTLLRHCHRIFRDLEEASSEVAQNGQTGRGTLRVGGGMSVCTYLLPHILKEYKTRYPNVQLTVTTGTTEPTIQKIRNNEIDVGVLSLPVDYPDLQVEFTFREEMVLVMSPNHPLSRKEQINVKDLENTPLILFERGSNTRKAIDRFLDRHIRNVNIIMEMENVEIIKPLVDIGLGVTIIPYQSIIREVQMGSLRYARFEGHPLYRELGLVYLKMSYQPISLKRMITLFSEMIARLQVSPP